MHEKETTTESIPWKLAQSISLEPSNHQMIDNDVYETLSFYSSVSIGQAINVFGSITNIINLVIFVKLGFRDTVNISLFGLAISDLCSLISLLLWNIFLTPSFYSLDFPFVPYDFGFLVFAWGHVGFTRVTCYLTAFISLERCICITAPLKVKSILTPRRTGLIVACIFPLIFPSVTPIFCTARLSWRFSPTRNRTLLKMVYNDKRKVMESISSIVNNAVPALAFVIIVSCTVITVLQLKQKAQWRKSSAHAGNQSAVSQRDKKAGQMVVLISSIFILCYLPSVGVFIWQMYDPELRHDGRQSNTLNVSISLLFLCEAVNASVNIFVYLTMSSKYKAMFRRIFWKCYSTSV